MKIKVHRGSNQIGGCVTEYESDGWKLFVDYGEQLPGALSHDTVFHTGDFRQHGFRSGKLKQVIERYIWRVDYVVCEATNVNRPEATLLPEHELQKEFVEVFTENKYNVVYVSSTNIDRLFGLYQAAIRAHRPFYVDAYQKRIMDTVAGRDTIWGKSSLYNYIERHDPHTLIQRGTEFVPNNKFIDFVSERGYVLVARPGERFDKLLNQLPNEGRIKYLSMWNGYLDESKAAYNPALAKSIGNEYRYMHTSGHCDMKRLDELQTVCGRHFRSC